MPSKSKKQHNLMEMVANNPQKAKQLGISSSVGEDFVQDDKKNGKFSVKKKNLIYRRMSQLRGE